MRYFDYTTEDKLREMIEKSLTEDNGYLTITSQVTKDLGKVKVSYENWEDQPGSKFPFDPLLGYTTFPNGLVAFGFCCGGDWEIPVFHILYASKGKLRGYTPTNGNSWNTTTNQAYGNDEEADLKNLRKRFGDHLTEEDLSDFEIPDAAKLLTDDIINHILPDPKSIKPKPPSFCERIEQLKFYGIGDEGYELFTSICGLAYQMSGIGSPEYTETLVGWAEEQARDSFKWAEENDQDMDDVAKGYWGHQ